MGLRWWRRKHYSSITKAEVERVATEVHSKQHDRVVTSSHSKVGAQGSNGPASVL